MRDYRPAAAQLYEAVRPTASHAFPPPAEERAAAAEVIRRHLEAAHLAGAAEAVLTALGADPGAAPPA